MNSTLKLMIMGYSQHGKGESCKYLHRNYNYSFCSSSAYANACFIYDILKIKYGYKSLTECFNDRHNHQAEWFELIKKFNTPDKTRLGRLLYNEFDAYDGIREIDEFNALKEAKLFDLSIWIDASLVKPIEKITSCTVKPYDADIIIDNNGTLNNLYYNIDILMSVIQSYQEHYVKNNEFNSLHVQQMIHHYYTIIDK